MNNEIGFYCPTISADKNSDIIVSLLNKISDKYNTIMFNSQYNLLDRTPRKFAVIHCNQAKYFYGNLFTFDIDSVSVVRSFPGPNKKIYIASTIFWENKSYPARVWYDLIMNDIDIITYDKKIYDLYSICFKSPIYNMVNGLNTEEFINVIDSLYSIK